MISLDEDLNSGVFNEYDFEPDFCLDEESQSKLNITFEKNSKCPSKITLRSLKRASKSDLSQNDQRICFKRN